MAKRTHKEKEEAAARDADLDASVLDDLGHKMRNPLNAILGAAALLEAGEGSPEQHELARIIQSGAEQLTSLLDEELDSLVVPEGGLELALHPFDVRASVERCLARVAEAAGDKQVDLEFRVEPSVPAAVIGDSSRVEQVLLTLLRAGLDRTERGGVGVELSSLSDRGRLELTFRVRDTGSKIPAAAVQAAMGDSGALSGIASPQRFWVLNMAKCRLLTELMDGRLWVESVGDGSAPTTECGFSVVAEAVPASMSNQRVSLDGMRVLVIAASADERRLMALQAELWGAVATSVEPRQAIAHMEAGAPADVAVIEHRNPAIDGLAVAREIRARFRPANLPIVLVAAKSPGEAEAAAADGGLVQATLTKPFAADKLHDVLVQVSAAPTSIPERPPEPAPGVLRVLVVDDNALNRTMMRKLVTRLGHHVEVVTNGSEAVQAVADHEFDAVLMDILMPEMDGLDAARAICSRWPRGTRPRLIALTALARPGDRERCLAAGLDDYISKPVHLGELRAALEHAAGWRTAPRKPTV